MDLLTISNREQTQQLKNVDDLLLAENLDAGIDIKDCTEYGGQGSAGDKLDQTQHTDELKKIEFQSHDDNKSLKRLTGMKTKIDIVN